MLDKIKIAILEPKILLALNKNKSVRIKYRNCEDKNMTVKIREYKDGILHLSKLGTDLKSTAKIENIECFDIIKSFDFYKRKINKLLQRDMYQEAYDVAFKELNQFHLDSQQLYLQSVCDNCKAELFRKCQEIKQNKTINPKTKNHDNNKTLYISRIR